VAELAPPVGLTALGERVAARVEALLAAEMARWGQVDAGLVEPLDSLRRLVAAGGKRIRPAFCQCGYLAAGGTAAAEAVVDAGAALELLHTFALIHDDIIDGSARRRGLPCLHVDYADRHRQRAWRGEASRFGQGAAMLIGDLAFVYADQLMQGSPPAALGVFTELRLEVNVGQYLDLVMTAGGQATVDQARTIGVYKSGKYTIERPLHLGAALGGRLDELDLPLTAYGLPLGEAFQLRDDLLGAFGDDEVLGKEVGEDFREGKPTALFALALARATGADVLLLRERYGQPDLTEPEVTALQEVLIRTGARAEVEATVESLVGQAVDALALLPLVGSVQEELIAMAQFVAGRDH
jgi:geranylgeranyl diphosphate synthase type I